MARGKLREMRAIAVAQIMMLFTNVRDVSHFIETGEYEGNTVTEKMPYDPAVAEYIAKIHANGGKFVMPEVPEGA